MANVVQTSAVLMSLVAGAVLEGSPQCRVVPFEYVADHLVVVRGAIGAMTGMSFIVDTGTARTVIDERIAGQLPSTRRRDVLEVFGTVAAADRIVAPVISFGSVRVSGIEALVADLRPQQERFGRRIDALLGMDVFQEQCLTIDYAARRLELECSGSLRQGAPFTPPLPIVVVSIDGRAFRLIADSGSQIIAVFRASLPEGTPVGAEARVAASHLTGTMELTRFSPREVLVGGHSGGAPPVFVIDAGRKVEGYDGVLGTRWLTDRQVRFDVRRGVSSWATAQR